MVSFFLALDSSSKAGFNLELGAHALSPAHHRGQIPNQPPLPKPRERDRWVKIKWHHGADYCGVFSQPELRDVYEVQNTVKVCIGINKTCEWKIALVRDQSLSCTTFKKFRTSSIESPLDRGALNRQRLRLTFDADSSRKRLGFFWVELGWESHPITFVLFLLTYISVSGTNYNLWCCPPSNWQYTRKASVGMNPMPSKFFWFVQAPTSVSWSDVVKWRVMIFSLFFFWNFFLDLELSHVIGHVGGMSKNKRISCCMRVSKRWSIWYAGLWGLSMHAFILKKIHILQEE